MSWADTSREIRWKEHIQEMRDVVNYECDAYKTADPYAILHRKCPECRQTVLLRCGRKSGQFWFMHMFSTDCIFDGWRHRVRFKSREEAMNAQEIFRE